MKKESPLNEARAADPTEPEREPTAAADADAAKLAKKPIAVPLPESEAERWARHKSNFKTIGGAILLAFVIRIMLVEAFEIDGPSMEPTLLNGDRVVVAKYPFGLFLPFSDGAIVSWGMPDPGDVVIVKSPADGVDIVKRVIGVPGDVIEVRDGEVFRNGESIRVGYVRPCAEDEQLDVDSACGIYEEHVGDRHWHVSFSETTFGFERAMAPVRVPEGHIFVLGDHRDHSNDSRNPRVGMIPIARVKGRAIGIYFSAMRHVRWERMFTGIQ